MRTWERRMWIFYFLMGYLPFLLLWPRKRACSRCKSPPLFSLICWATESAPARHISQAVGPARNPLSLPFQIVVCLSLSPALPHCSQVRLLLAGWEDETWSHSSRWWHWQEQPVTQNCLNRAEVRAICGWRRELRARGWWSSGLVRTNMSTYG